MQLFTLNKSERIWCEWWLPVALNLSNILISCKTNYQVYNFIFYNTYKNANNSFIS
jgi:hypothetical protein